MFGIISLLISAGFILVQKDIKRMLAYSSIEHMGLISVGFGLGGFYAIFGSLLHILNHAVTKSLMFFCSGNIINTYKKHDMRSIRGIMSIMPLTGTFFIIGTFALAGFPPFSIFRSELLIIFGAFMKGSFILGTIVLLLVAFVFAALIFHVSQMLFGQKPKELIEASEPVSSKYSLFFLLIFILTLGIFIPNDLSIIITQAAKIVGEL